MARAKRTGALCGELRTGSVDRHCGLPARWVVERDGEEDIACCTQHLSKVMLQMNADSGTKRFSANFLDYLPHHA